MKILKEKEQRQEKTKLEKKILKERKEREWKWRNDLRK